MERSPAEHPQHRFGVSSYSLDQFGRSTSMLEPVFGEFLSTFDIELEGKA